MPNNHQHALLPLKRRAAAAATWLVSLAAGIIRRLGGLRPPLAPRCGLWRQTGTGRPVAGGGMAAPSPRGRSSAAASAAPSSTRSPRGMAAIAAAAAA